MVISLMHLTRLPASTLYRQATRHASAATANVRERTEQRTTTTSAWMLCLRLLMSRVEGEDPRPLRPRRGLDIEDLHLVGGEGYALLRKGEPFEGRVDRATPSVPPLLMAAAVASPSLSGLAVVLSLRP